MARKSATEAKGTKKGLEATLSELQKQFGSEVVVRMGDAPRDAIEVIPTGIAGLDIALGRGGLPRGRIIEIFGPESSGKTTLALSAVASAQQLGGVAAFIDAEHAIDPEYAEKLGVNVNDLILSQPDNGEQALEIADRLAASGEIAIIVIDSVAALTPRSEIEGEMGDANVGKQARMMSQGLRKLTAHVNNTGTTLIFINQLREKIGVMFGNPETTTGGKALKFYASIRIDIRASQKKEGEEVIGNSTRVKIIKNKVAAPFKKCEYETRYDDTSYFKKNSLLKAAEETGVIEKSGGWYSYNGESLREKKLMEMLNDPSFYENIYAQVMKEVNAEFVEDEVPDNVDPETGEILDESPDEIGNDNLDDLFES